MSAVVTPNRWVHYVKGSRCGEWTTTDFADRAEALSWATDRARVTGAEVTVTEIPRHSTLSRERLIVAADGTVKRELGTVIS